VARTWKRGDTVTLKLPMEPRRVTAGAHIADDTGRVALQRGPVVYALEGIDNGGKALGRTLAPLGRRYDIVDGPAALGDVKEITAQDLTFVPYYAWANRGPGEMAVWITAAPAKQP